VLLWTFGQDVEWQASLLFVNGRAPTISYKFLQDKDNYPEEELLVNPPKEVIQESNAIKCDVSAILSKESVWNEIERLTFKNDNNNTKKSTSTWMNIFDE